MWLCTSASDVNDFMFYVFYRFFSMGSLPEIKIDWLKANTSKRAYFSHEQNEKKRQNVS